LNPTRTIGLSHINVTNRVTKWASDDWHFIAHKDKNPKAAAKTVSGRVSEWLRELAIVPEGLSPNHAWRHRFKTAAIDEGVGERVADAIQGHASKTAGDDYGDVTLKARKSAIDRLPTYALS